MVEPASKFKCIKRMNKQYLALTVSRRVLSVGKSGYSKSEGKRAREKSEPLVEKDQLAEEGAEAASADTSVLRVRTNERTHKL